MGRNCCAEFVVPLGARNRRDSQRTGWKTASRLGSRAHGRTTDRKHVSGCYGQERAAALEMTSDRQRADTGRLIRAMPGAGIFRSPHQASTTVTAALSSRPPGGRFSHGALRSRGLDAQDQARPCAPVSWAVFRPACRARRSAPAEARVQFPLSRCISRDSPAPVRWWLGAQAGGQSRCHPSAGQSVGVADAPSMETSRPG